VTEKVRGKHQSASSGRREACADGFDHSVQTDNHILAASPRQSD